MPGSQSTLGRTSVQRRLGVVGNNLANVSWDAITPVLIAGVLGSLTTEPFEARGIAGGSQSAAGHAGFEIQAFGGGGLVVERLLAVTGATPSIVYVLRSSGAPVLGALAPSLTQDVGGLPLRAVVQQGAAVGIPPSATPIIGAATTVLERLVVPAGSRLSVLSGTPGFRIDWSLLWRELEDVQGGPT